MNVDEVKYRVQLQSGIFSAPDTARRIDALMYRRTATQEMGCAIGNCIRAVTALVKSMDDINEDEFNAKLSELEDKHTTPKTTQSNTALPPVTSAMFANIVNKALATKDDSEDDKPKKPKRGAAWTAKKQREFGLWADTNFRAGDLFVTLTLSEDNRDKADDKLKQWRKAMRKFIEGQLAEKYGRSLMWRYLGVKEYGKRGTKRKHFHLLFAVVDEDGNDVTKEVVLSCKSAIRAEWQGRGIGGIDIREVDRKLGCLCWYMSKAFDKTPTYAHAYFKSKSLKPFETTTIDIGEEEFDTLFEVYRNGDITALCKHLEGLPQMQGYRLMTEPQVHDPAPAEVEDSPFMRFTILNIREDIETGLVAQKRNIGDVEYFYEDSESHIKANTFVGVGERLQLGAWDNGMMIPSAFSAGGWVQYNTV